MQQFFQAFGGMMGGMAMPHGPGFVWEETLRAYSMAVAGKDIKDGDKIMLPASALEKLTMMHVQYPMMFKVTNPRGNRATHCGVMEFSAREGHCYLPQWIMENLVLEEGALIVIRNVQLPKGRFVKFRPHSKDFLDISNPRAVLEKQLRLHSCLTKGDVLMFNYLNKAFYMDVLETKPADGVSIIETDMEVDFAPPCDYVEPPRPSAAATSSKGAAMSDDGDEEIKILSPGGGATSGGAAAASSSGGGAGGPAPVTPSDAARSATAEAAAARAARATFVGTGRRLGGDLGGAASGGAAAATTAASPVLAPSAGGVVLSSGTSPASAAKPRTLNKFEAKRAAASFQGKGMSLRD